MNYENASFEKLQNLARGISRLRFLEERERLEGSLIDFFEAAWPHMDPAPYVGGWHLEAIAEHLQAVAEGKIRKLLINVPPRHSKTLITSVAFPAWVWARESDPDFPLIGPQVKFMCLSYGDQLAMDNATLGRRLVASDWYQKRWGDRVKIASDQDAKNKFDTSVGGTRISSSFGGGILGRGGDIKILDDAHKVEEAESEVTRNRVIKSYDGTLKSRITDPKISAEIIIMQRLHESDLSGHVLEGNEDFVHLCLPAEYEPDRHCSTVLGWEDPRTEEGELLWPERFTLDALKPFKVNPYEWAGQWQQRPSPTGGGILKIDWWEPWGRAEAMRYGLTWEEDDITDGVLTKGRRDFPPFSFLLASFDGAMGQKAENDFSALTIWGCFSDLNGNPRFMLVTAWREKLAFHELVERIALTCRKYGVHRLLVEAKANGLDVSSEIRRLHSREMWVTELINPGRLDKTSRAHSVVPLFASGMIFAPDTKWAQMVIDECASFPKGAHDDLVDTVTQALHWLRENNLAIRSDEIAAQFAEEAMNWKRPTEALYPGI